MTEEEKQAIQHQFAESLTYLAGVRMEEEKKRQEICTLRDHECERIEKYLISEQERIQKENQSRIKKTSECGEAMKDAMKKGDTKEVERLLKDLI